MSRGYRITTIVFTVLGLLMLVIGFYQSMFSQFEGVEWECVSTPSGDQAVRQYCDASNGALAMLGGLAFLLFGIGVNLTGLLFGLLGRHKAPPAGGTTQGGTAQVGGTPFGAPSQGSGAPHGGTPQHGSQAAAPQGMPQTPHGSARPSAPRADQPFPQPGQSFPSQQPWQHPNG